MKLYDLAIIGGGVNGCGIARDAAGRGLAVHLCEKGDLGSGTSSASTKLAHGGLRYLETMEFRLVREALAEREALLRIAPHIVRPMRFVLPHRPGLRAWPIIRLGLFVYDSLGGRRTLSGSRSIDLARDDAGASLRSPDGRAFEYSDCWVDDARLVVLNAMDAAERGATIATRTACVAAERTGGVWRVTLDGPQGRSTIRARGLVNAAGPWVPAVAQGSLRANAAADVRLVRGSHIVTPRLFEHDRAYLLQQRDGRVVFAIPYEDDFTLIGTTDADYHGDPRDVRISEQETDYLLSAASEYFTRPVTREQIHWTYSGVRPLFDDGASAAQEATRDYVLKVDGDAATGAAINVFGGKLTTSRRLAESVLEKIEGVLGKKGAAWTRTSRLPGGEFEPLAFEAEARRLRMDYPDMPARLLRRLLRQYGTKARVVLGKATEVDDLGQHFGWDLYAAEVDYLVAHEWARTAQDVLWRRTKVGLRVSAEEVAALEGYMAR